MGGYKLGRLWGFPIEIRVSFLILLGVVTLGGLLQGHPLVSLMMLLTTFLGVLLHELGHAVVARRLGVSIAGIELHVFGGMAKMMGMPRSPRDEIVIAAAGPAVSLVLASLGGGIYALTGSTFAQYVLWTNLLLGLFNLLPALPMDGGRIFRAALAHRLGRVEATLLSVKVAKVLAVLMGVGGVLTANLWLAALAVMLYVMANAEASQVHLWSYDEAGRGERWWQPPRDGRRLPRAWPLAWAFSRETYQGRGPGHPSSDVFDAWGGPVVTSRRSIERAGICVIVEGDRWGETRSWVLRGTGGRVVHRSDAPRC